MFTKVMERLSIAEPWRNSVHVLSTDEASAASARTKKALRSERQVCEYLSALGWKVLYHNVQCLGVQVDILARTPKGLLTLVEVKSQSLSGHAHLPLRQHQRLQRVSEHLAEFEPVQLQVAYVEGPRVRLVPVDGLTPS